MNDLELKENFYICIAGKNNIAVDTLDYLLNNKKFPKNKILVICNKNDKGINTAQRSLKLFAKNNDIKIVTLEDVYHEQNLLFLSLEFDRIVEPALFKTKYLYNIHFSLLPKYKGMYTSAMPLLLGETQSGVTFHEIDKGIDTGKIIFQEHFQIDPKDTCKELYIKCIYTGTKLIKKVLDFILSGKNLPEAIMQNPYKSTYFSKKAIDYKNLKVDLNQTAQNICNQIRAYNYREYQIPKIFNFNISWAEITNITSKEKPGSIVWKDNERIVIASIDYDVMMFIDKFNDVLKMCYMGDLDGLKQIPNLNIYLNQSEKGGWSPLMIATRLGYYDMAMYLLYSGADINALNWEGVNLLMCAKDGFCKTGDSRLFELFYKMGIKKEKKDYNNKDLIYYCKAQKIPQIGNFIIYT